VPIVLQPVDQIAHAELAQRLACWAKAEDGFTDNALIYQSCCVSPTGQTLGRWVVDEALCATYGPFDFTGNEGEVIPCPAPGSAEYVNFYIYDDDVHAIDPNTCIEQLLAAPTGLNSPTQGPTTVDLAWNAVPDAQRYVVRWSLAGQDDWTELAPTFLLTAEVTGLTDETSYDFQVQAIGVGFVDSPWSATLTQATTSLGTLAAPTGVANPSSTGTTIDVTWNAVDNATGYTVEWSPTGAGTWTPATTATNSYTITGLTIGTSYDIRVKATAPDWTDSPYSAQIIGSTEQQLATPAGLASPSQTGLTVNLTWSAVTNADTYVVRHSPAGAGTWTELAPVGITSATVSGLTASTSYDFQVKAQADDFVDSAWSTTLTQSTAAVLATPVLTSPSQTDTTVALTWGAVPNATSYTVQWSLAPSGSWNAMPDVSGTGQTVTGLTAATSYRFRVLAHAAGWTDSAWSAELTQATDAALAAPTGVNSPSQTASTIDVAWTAVAGADGYTVEWSPAGAGTWTPATNADTTYTIIGLAADTAYDIRVKATATGFADSAYSTVFTQSTLEVQLAAPTGFASPSQTDTSINTSWDAVDDAASYVVEWSPAGAGTWTPVPAATTTQEITGLSAATNYDLRVKAVAPDHIDSTYATLTQETHGPLLAPSSLASPSQTATTVDLTWDAAINADFYVVRHSPAGAGTWTEEPQVSGTSDTVSGLTASTSYDFQVKTIADGFADSGWSGSLTQSTTA
jgi:hypothetical protein